MLGGEHNGHVRHRRVVAGHDHRSDHRPPRRLELELSGEIDALPIVHADGQRGGRRAGELQPLSVAGGGRERHDPVRPGREVREGADRLLLGDELADRVGVALDEQLEGHPIERRALLYPIHLLDPLGADQDLRARRDVGDVGLHRRVARANEHKLVGIPWLRVESQIPHLDVTLRNDLDQAWSVDRHLVGTGGGGVGGVDEETAVAGLDADAAPGPGARPVSSSDRLPVRPWAPWQRRR